METSVQYLWLKSSLFFALFMFCTATNAQFDKLKGEWLCTSEYGNVKLGFADEKNLVYDGIGYPYQLSQDNIIVTAEGNQVTYPYRFQDIYLIVTFPEGYSLLFNQISKTYSLPQKQVTLTDNSLSTGGNTFLRGSYCEYSGSSSSYSETSYSNLNKIYCDGAGKFSYGSESSFSGNTGMAYGNSNAHNGTYQIAGQQVTFTFSNGESYRMKINMVQNSGQITELMFGSKLYATGLCE